MLDKINRVKQLVMQLNQYSYEYYTLGEPTISDETYDYLYDELLQLENETNYILSNSPTQKVGNIVLDKLQKVKHEYPLLSLDKTKSIDTLSNFTKGKDGVLMLKADGLTIDIIYDSGEFISAETRGNGIEGELISHNVKTFTNVPLKIPCKNRVHIIGEAIITYDTFEKINSKLSTEDRYRNPRNLVSGSVRQLDSNICKNREVKFYGYIVEGVDLKSKYEQLKFIKEQGFDMIPWWSYANNDDINLLIKSLKATAQIKRIPIDGLVMCYNDMQYGKSLGGTSHHPLHSIAFKFQDEIEITKLNNVEWQVGRTGQITPVAYFDTVILDGTEVSKASLHNVSIFKKLNLHKGDEISTYKANQIIPQIKDNLGGGTDLIQMPTHCPCCGYPTEIRCDKESEVLYCINPNCKAKLIQRLVHYCSRNAMNIEGMSEKTLEKFIELGFIKDILDIYFLQIYKDKIVNLDGFGTKSYSNMINSIGKSKTCKLEQFVFALGIPNVGKSTSKDICNHFNNDFDAIFNCTESELLNIKDIGETTANSFVKFIEDSNNIYTITELEYLLTFEANKPKEQIEGILQGKSYYLTGTFSYGKKTELKQLVESNGGIFAEKFNKQIDGLVIGKLKGSSKDKKAIEWGIPVISEDEFIDMVNTHN